MAQARLSSLSRALSHLRSNYPSLHFHRSLCSSQSPLPVPESEPVRAPLQPISYPVKPKPEQLQVPNPNPSNSSVEDQNWSREDIRYVKAVSYPSRVAPLPEDRPVNDEASEQMERERMKIEADNRVIRRVLRVEEDKEVTKIPFPTLIKVQQNVKDKVVYDLKDAIQLLKTNAKKNFDETVEAHVKLTSELRRTDLKLTGSASLPHGTGKAVRVVVFAEGPAADEARAAGADIVGGEELIAGIKNGNIKVDFDKCIATPQIMSRVSKEISKVLRRLTPNAKEGTVTNDISRVVREAKQNIIFRKDKSAIVHVGLGKASFGEEALRENVGAFVNALLLAKPAGLKKSSKYAGYVSTFHLCSTMGPSYPVSIQSLSIAADRYNKLQMR